MRDVKNAQKGLESFLQDIISETKTCHSEVQTLESTLHTKGIRDVRCEERGTKSKQRTRKIRKQIQEFINIPLVMTCNAEEGGRFAGTYA